MNIAINLLGIFFIIFLAWHTIQIIKRRQKLAKENDTVKIIDDINKGHCISTIITACLWVLLSVANIIQLSNDIDKINNGYYDNVNRPASVSVEEYRESLIKKPGTRRKLYILALSSWSITGILYAVQLKKGKYTYISSKGVYRYDKFIPADKYRYRIKSEKLLLYYKKLKSPMEYSIEEDKDRLEAILSESYSVYS